MCGSSVSCLFGTRPEQERAALFHQESATSATIQRRNHRICPLPNCGSCPTVEALRAHGIDLALDNSHGTAAVRLHNGTFLYTSIRGDASYVSLMRRLGNRFVEQDPDTDQQPLSYLWHQFKRGLRTSFALAASPDLSILAGRAARLLQATRDQLGDDHYPFAAVLSSPDPVQLMTGEIDDVFGYLEVSNLMNIPWSLWQLYATSAAYVGYGKGLCQAYTDAYACEREDLYLPTQRLLHIDFSVEALSGTIKTVWGNDDGSVHDTFIDHALGLKHERGRYFRTMSDGRDFQQHYCPAIAHRIRQLVDSPQWSNNSPYVTDLILTGQTATDPGLSAAIRDALHDLVANQKIFTVLEDMSASDSDDSD